ncbi:hypothetical protein LCS82_09000 [Vibrio harveyi]|uniref:hypothetical protein n=1 Tax=Vibrio harveyi TaxID=669 RepID=UPI003BB78EAD
MTDIKQLSYMVNVPQLSKTPLELVTMITNKPKTVEEHMSLIGTKWHINEEVRVIIDIENLTDDHGSISGDILFRVVGSAHPVRTVQLRFFRRWLKSAVQIDSEWLNQDSHTNTHEIEQHSNKLKATNAEIMKLNKERDLLVEQLRRLKSIEFIRDNNLTLDKVQVLDEKYTFAHDNEKHYAWLMKKVSMEWFTVFGLIFKKSEFKRGDLCNGSDGRYLELLLLAA